MQHRVWVAAWVMGIFLFPGFAWGTCPPSCSLPGGGSVKQDCHAEFAATNLRLNYPPFNPSRPALRSRSIRCFDGDAGCDLDGQVNRECRFDIDVCLHNADPNLPTCTPSTVTAVSVSNPRGANPDLQALQTALNALLPADTNVCTTGQTLRVPLLGPDRFGHYRRGTKTVRLTAKTAGGKDVDSLELNCVPREWPSHGYNHANHRATPLETKLTPANAANLVVKWTFDLSTGMAQNAVTSTPTVGDGLVYVTSWNGKVYALKAQTGAVKWTYDTGSGSQPGAAPGVQSSATLTPDGRVLVGDSRGTVHCLRAKDGFLLWTVSVAGTDIGTSHIWDSPVVASGRVFVGRASHGDQPCTRGHLYAFNLDTGAELWEYATVPEKVCNNDTAITCTVDSECGAGTCVDAKGGGITASVAVDPTGETVYMVPVGCYTFPSVGNADSFFSLQAATGTPNWIYRTEPIEQFHAGVYHDYGFLNGPLLVDADDGLGGTRALVVGGSKDGTLYAVDPSTGSPVWTNPLIAPPAFAGFGLFNGAVGFANHTLYAALYNGGGAWPAGSDHLYAFSDLAGAAVWQQQIGASWGSVAIANGLLFVGTQDAPAFYVYDAATGTQLKAFTMPDNVSSGASIVDGTVYVGYGVFGATGGVKAFALP